MTEQEKVVWKNTILAMSVATIEMSMMIKDNLVEKEKKALNRMIDKFRVMLRSFDSAVEHNPSFQRLVMSYGKFTEKAVKLQMDSIDEKEQ